MSRADQILRNPAKIAAFWEAALGWRRTWDEEDQVALEPPEGSREDGVVPDLLFLRVPESKQTVSRTELFRSSERRARLTPTASRR